MFLKLRRANLSQQGETYGSPTFLNKVLAGYEGAAVQLGSTLILQEQNNADLKANTREHQSDLRRWRSRKSRNEHRFFIEGTRNRRKQILFEGIKLETLIGHLQDELRESRRKLQGFQLSLNPR